MTTTIANATWEQCFDALRSGVWGDVESLKAAAMRSIQHDLIEMDLEGHGITMSDINHTLYPAMKITLSYGGSREDLLSYLDDR